MTSALLVSGFIQSRLTHNIPTHWLSFFIFTHIEEEEEEERACLGGNTEEIKMGRERGRIKV